MSGTFAIGGVEEDGSAMTGSPNLAMLLTTMRESPPATPSEAIRRAREPTTPASTAEPDEEALKTIPRRAMSLARQAASGWWPLKSPPKRAGQRARHVSVKVNLSCKMSQRYDVLAFGAHPDDLEVVMGGKTAKLASRGQSILFVDLWDGEPARHAGRGARQAQAASAAAILGAQRRTLEVQDRLMAASSPPGQSVVRCLCRPAP
jgi:hypothetical protein